MFKEEMTHYPTDTEVYTYSHTYMLVIIMYICCVLQPQELK